MLILDLKDNYIDNFGFEIILDNFLNSRFKITKKLQKLELDLSNSEYTRMKLEIKEQYKC